MPLLTAAECRDHCRADSGDDAILLAFLAAAEDAAAAYLNRTIHADSTALDAAIAAYPDVVAAAHAAYDAAVDAADTEEANGDSYKATAMREVAVLNRASALRNAERAANGVVANPSIVGAVKLTLGHLYANRESVSEEAMTEVPQGVTALLRPYRLVQMP